MAAHGNERGRVRIEASWVCQSPEVSGRKYEKTDIVNTSRGIHAVSLMNDCHAIAVPIKCGPDNIDKAMAGHARKADKLLEQLDSHG